MGTPNSFIVSCQWCGNIEAIQSKFYGSILLTYRVGDSIYTFQDKKEAEFFRNILLELKDSCSSCRKPYVILILKGKYYGVVAMTPMARELSFGNWEHVK